MFSFFKKLDWQLNAAVLILIAGGLVSLASTSPIFFHRQLVWVGLSFIVFFLIIKFDWRSFINYRGAIFGLYLLLISLLIITYFLAPTIRGVRGWLPLGFFQFQVSEFAKLVLIILYAYFFSRKHIGIARLSNLVVSFIYFLIPGFLIAIQPDLGSALVIFAFGLDFFW